MLRNSQFRRISSNYLRMAITFVVGIWLLQLFLGFGDGAYAVIALTASSIGIAEILKETVRGATISELGKSYFSNSKEYFAKTYASSIFLSLISAFFSIFILSIFLLYLDFFNIPEQLTNATAFYIKTRIVYVFLSIALSPVHNMMPIMGRMVSYNIWLTLDRVSDLVSALAASYYLFSGNGADKLIVFSSISLALKVLVLLFATIWVIKSDNQLLPNYKLVSLKHLKRIGHLIGWNAAAVLSVNLYLRFDTISVNILYGVEATIIFGLASQLAAYISISSMGFVSGLDAVVTQYSKQSNNQQLRETYKLNKKTIELQALILGYLFVILALHSEYIITQLFSDKLNSNIDINVIKICFFILMSGLICRGMSEGWMGTLTGMGRIKSYALPVLTGAILNPILVIVVGQSFDLEYGLYLICLIFLILNILFHMIYIPKVTASTLGVRTGKLVSPILTPMALTLFAIFLSYSIGPLASKEHFKLLLTIIITSSTIGPYFIFKTSLFFKDKNDE